MMSLIWSIHASLAMLPSLLHTFISCRNSCMMWSSSRSQWTSRPVAARARPCSATPVASKEAMPWIKEARMGSAMEISFAV
uniref:Secreted protein n=1 Tax=Arundo donax TaxID=35708 RepID=A0A0A8ZBH9_ARUDO